MSEQYRYYLDENGDRLVEIKMRLTADNEYPAKFKSFVIRIPRCVPEEFVDRLVSQEVERMRNSMENWKDWKKFIVEKGQK